METSSTETNSHTLSLGSKSSFGACQSIQEHSPRAELQIMLDDCIHNPRYIVFRTKACGRGKHLGLLRQCKANVIGLSLTVKAMHLRRAIGELE